MKASQDHNKCCTQRSSGGGASSNSTSERQATHELTQIRIRDWTDGVMAVKNDSGDPVDNILGETWTWLGDFV